MMRTEMMEKEQKTVLLIDGDNIYFSLRNRDERLAEAFVMHPETTLKWLIESKDAQFFDEVSRRFLVMRIYLNPNYSWKYRSNFTNAGFQVIDTPPLTASNKTAADMMMAVDALDLMRDLDVYYNEFVIISADADFTPLLLRLRQAGRHTAILPVGQSSQAYRAIADLVISQEHFIQDGLLQGEPLPEREEPDYDLCQIASAIKEVVQTAHNAVDLATVAHQLKQRFSCISHDWCGHGSMKKLVMKLDLAPLELMSTGPSYLYDPSIHSAPLS